MEEALMLLRLVLLFWELFPLEAELRPSRFHPTPKEGLRPPTEPKGCLVNEACDGDFVSSRDLIPLGDIVPATNDFSSRNPKGDEVVVFVSFSMPEASLKALSDAASKHKAVLVMHGLYENSFVKTAEKLRSMGVVVDINPELFETYQVDNVPVFVRLQYGKEVARLSGNVSLDFAVSKLRDVS
jgi:type-F conjugative transfer system pilin assembly protein TrbC